MFMLFRGKNPAPSCACYHTLLYGVLGLKPYLRIPPPPPEDHRVNATGSFAFFATSSSFGFIIIFFPLPFISLVFLPFYCFFPSFFPCFWIRIHSNLLLSDFRVRYNFLSIWFLIRILPLFQNYYAVKLIL
jgi:hypothetical protein